MSETPRNIVEAIIRPNDIFRRRKTFRLITGLKDELIIDLPRPEMLFTAESVCTALRIFRVTHLGVVEDPRQKPPAETLIVDPLDMDNNSVKALPYYDIRVAVGGEMGVRFVPPLLDIHEDRHGGERVSFVAPRQRPHGEQ